MSQVDRYHAVGLRRNPFAARQPGDPPLAAFVDRGLPEPPPPRSSTLVQVIGVSGVGKSTQLDRWRSLAPAPLHYVPARPLRARWAKPPEAAHLLYGDEIDRMPRPLRLRWFRSCARLGTTLVIGTHADLGGIARRAGFADIRTHHLAPVDLDTFVELVDLRIRSESLTPDHLRLDPDDLEHIHQQAGGLPGEADVLCHRRIADLVSASR